MERKLSAIFVTLLMCLTAIVIVPHNNDVKADTGSGGNSELDAQFIHRITENLSNVIYNAYSDGELQKGRAFGSKGEHYAADYIYNEMNQIGLSNLQKDRIGNIPDDVTAIDDCITLTPRVIPIGGQLALDQIFNGLVNTNDLQNGNGTYRIFAALRAQNGTILKTDDEVELTAWYEFTVTYS